ncbi:MAG: hypothetical protein JWR69_1354 [Pedosphaera sp.]|nr:hypothetical protein [Pedosphaera sp.]
MTEEKIRAYANSVELSKLSAAERAKAIRKLADKVNALALEERRRWRMDGIWRDWFEDMTEEERGQFIEATLPTGFKQVITAFEDLPEAKRKKAIDDAMKQLRETRQLPTDREPGQEAGAYGTNGPPPMNPDLERKVRALGLKTFYNESSAQTKAELAPLLEELQHQMQSGRSFR